MELTGKRVIVSGGAGFLGRSVVARLLACGCDVTVVSRDEEKLARLRRSQPAVRTRLCDIRDYELLRRCARGHDYGIWAASLKQIDTCVDNWQVAKEVIVDGALNSRRVSEELLEAAVFVSTDKAKAPTTLYGMLKAVAGECFLLAPESCRLTSTIYGNVWNSTGSVVPRIWDYIERDREMTLFHPDMTRFMIDVEHAVDVILDALSFAGCYVLPRLSSFRVRDLFEIFQEDLGLRFAVGRPRACEKIHEVMCTAQEMPLLRWQQTDRSGVFLLDPTRQAPDVAEHTLGTGEYCSADHLVDKQTLRSLLRERGLCQPPGARDD